MFGRATVAALIWFIVLGIGSADAATPPRIYSPWRSVHRFGDYGTNVLDDTSIAAAADLEQLWTAKTKPYVTTPLLKAYRALSPLDDDLSVTQLGSWWERSGIDGLTVKSMTKVAIDDVSIREEIFASRGLFAVVELPDAESMQADLPTSTPAMEWDTYVAPDTSPTGRAALTIPVRPVSVAAVGYWRGGVYIVWRGALVPVSWQWWRVFARAAWEVQR